MDVRNRWYWNWNRHDTVIHWMVAWPCRRYTHMLISNAVKCFMWFLCQANNSNRFSQRRSVSLYWSTLSDSKRIIFCFETLHSYGCRHKVCGWHRQLLSLPKFRIVIESVCGFLDCVWVFFSCHLVFFCQVFFFELGLFNNITRLIQTHFSLFLPLIRLSQSHDSVHVTYSTKCVILIHCEYVNRLNAGSLAKTLCKFALMLFQPSATHPKYAEHLKSCAENTHFEKFSLVLSKTTSFIAGEWHGRANKKDIHTGLRVDSKRINDRANLNRNKCKSFVEVNTNIVSHYVCKIASKPES